MGSSTAPPPNPNNLKGRSFVRELIDRKTSMISDKDPLGGLLFHWDLGFSHTLHVLKERRQSNYSRIPWSN